MYRALLFGVSLVILIVLWQLSILVGIVSLLVLLIGTPALTLHRRERAYAVEHGFESESRGRGVIRLFGHISRDFTGIALGVGFLLAVIVVIYVVARSGAL